MQGFRELDLSNLSILVVVDQPLMRKILCNVLGEFGVRDIVEAANGIDAGDKLKQVSPDVIFTDNIMRPEGGAEFVRRVRFGEYDVDACVPIIMVSAETGYTSITKARDAGINEFLAKPVSAKFVYDRLATVICRPRPFVRADSYFGPERRRRKLEPFYERRQRAFEYEPEESLPRRRRAYPGHHRNGLADRPPEGLRGTGRLRHQPSADAAWFPGCADRRGGRGRSPH